MLHVTNLLGFKLPIQMASASPNTSDHTVLLHTGTIMGVSKFLKGQRKDIKIVGLQPKEGARIPGIRRWPKEYLPKIFQVGALAA